MGVRGGPRAAESVGEALVGQSEGGPQALELLHRVEPDHQTAAPFRIGDQLNWRLQVLGHALLQSTQIGIRVA